MRVDTIFDLASLTKVVATTSSIMKLFEEGRIALNDRVRDYFPEFSAEGKGGITIRGPADALLGASARSRLGRAVVWLQDRDPSCGGGKAGCGSANSFHL